MADVRVKWARNTADAMGNEAEQWSGVEVVEDDQTGDVALYKGDDLVARFGKHDADVIVVDDK